MNSNAERLEELIEQAERAHGLSVLRVQPTKTLLKAIDGEIVEPLEKELAARNEDIGRLQGELGKALARIAELEAAQQWQPVELNFHCDDGKWRHLDVGEEDDDLIMITNDNPQIRYNFASITLPDDIRLCRKVQPQAVQNDAADMEDDEDAYWPDEPRDEWADDEDGEFQPAA